jgi:hypothetical protein
MTVKSGMIIGFEKNNDYIYNLSTGVIWDRNMLFIKNA